MMHALKAQFAAYPLDFYSQFLLLLPVFVALYRREFLTSILSVIVLYFGIRFIEECIFLYYTLIPKNTHSLSSGTLIVDTLLIGWCYFLGSESSNFARRLTVAMITVAFVVSTINYVLSGLESIGHSTLRILMIVLVLVYFNKVLAENRVRSVLLHSLFWVSSGFLVYGMGTFMTSLFKDYLLDPQKTSTETYDLFLYMDQILSILLSALAAIGLWVSKFDKENYIQLV
ncbi:hypothetical protein [Fibrella arboris]|uniref:hypothetical protein n=1 Tax=Fibrella arboris TaxID=3242486 RepID=UPI003521C891